MARNRTRAVVAFDKLTGTVAGRWECPRLASEDMGVSETSIVSQAKLRALPQGWTAFRFDGDDLVDPREGYGDRRCRPVLCTDGRAVVAFSSMAEAGKAIGCCANMVRDHCDNGKPVSFGGRDVVLWLPQGPTQALSVASKWEGLETVTERKPQVNRTVSK